jgi:hypothetical protein
LSAWLELELGFGRADIRPVDAADFAPCVDLSIKTG